MIRIYISGPMTGLPKLNKPAFIEAERQLVRRGFEVFNPARIVLDHDSAWEDYMRECIKALCDCDSLALLPGWEASRGALLEAHIANQLGLRVMAYSALVKA